MRTLISRLGEEQLCCAGKSCMCIHVLWSQPPRWVCASCPIGTCWGSSSVLHAQPGCWSSARNHRDMEGKPCLFLPRLEGMTAWHRAHPPGACWALFFPATARETLTKLERETEEVGKRQAETAVVFKHIDMQMGTSWGIRKSFW